MSPEASALARPEPLAFFDMEQMKTLNKTNVLFLAILAIASACKQTTSPPAAEKPQTPSHLPMPSTRAPESSALSKTRADMDAEMEKVLDKEYSGDLAGKEAAKSGMSALDARGDEEAKLAAINQRTMVVPAPADFRPEPVARKVRLNLILEKSRIRAGEAPRFRLELTNVGRETIDYQESQSSIFKGGSILNSLRTIRFYLVNEKGERHKLQPALGLDTPGTGHYQTAPDPEKALQEMNASSQASTYFKVTLRPGDTLRSLGDGNSATESFRTLQVRGGFREPGKYRLIVELDDRPKPLSQGYIKYAQTFSTLEEIKKTHARRLARALGPISSEAMLEVAR